MKIDIDTKNRLRRMTTEFKNEPKIKTFENTNKYQQMIVQAGIPFISKCEHHHVAFMGVAHVGYIPGGKLIGLSKMPRIVEHVFNPTTFGIQERGTKDIADYLSGALDNPLGVMVVIEALHGCLAYRGVKKPSITVTSEIQGAFADNTETRAEFLEHIRGHRYRAPF
jgi:GTP cyclohydrolase I